MKLVLLATLVVSWVNCQLQPYSFNPNFKDSMSFGRLRFYDAFYPPFFLPGGKGFVRNPYSSYELTGEQDAVEDIEGRFNLAKNQYFALPQNVPTQRFLFNMMNSGTGVQPASVLFRTSIVTSVVTTTIPSLSLCIPAAQFSDGAGAAPCARRRREIAEILDEFVQLNNKEDQGTQDVQPSPIESIETTASALSTPESVASPDRHSILSSKSESDESETSEDSAKRLKRFFNLLVTTTTITSYSFATTVVPKQVSVVNAVAGVCVAGDAALVGCLGCIPPGYGIC